MKTIKPHLFLRFLFLWPILWSTPLWAMKVQILHVNDLHGLMEHTGHNKSRGGYGALKLLIDRYKEEAKGQGVETLVFNSGDFQEGSIFYMSQEGLDTLSVLDLFQFDGVVLGNHDWLSGPQRLNDWLHKAQPKFPLLAANMEVSGPWPAIKKTIRPYTTKTLQGPGGEELKLAFVGLTTDEVFYSWLLDQTLISDPITVGEQWGSKLKQEQKADFVFALTHIGVKPDRALAQNTSSIDLIVGGHSHTTLKKPILEKNKNGVSVPIVQAGAHGWWLGKMLVDLVPGKPLRILSYELVPVWRTLSDETVEERVRQSKTFLEKMYGKSWLKEVVGYTDVDLINLETEATYWGYFIADAMKEAVDADVSIHISEFAGHNLAPGALTREDIFNAYPRVFDFQAHKHGWRLWQADMFGFALKWAIRAALWSGYSLHISGLTFDIIEVGGKKIPVNFKVNGSRLWSWARYRLALPEGFLEASYRISNLTSYLFLDPEKYEITIQEAISQKIQKEGTIGEGMQNKSLSVPTFDEESSRMMVPSSRR